MIDALFRCASKASQLVVWFGGACLLFAAVLTTLEVFLRKFANFSFGGADEIAGYLFAISTAFAFAFTMLHRANVRIDALYMRFPRPLQHFMDIVGFLALGGFISLVAYRAYFVWTGSLEHSSTSITPMQTPLAIPQGVWLLGLIFFLVVFVILALRAGQALVQRDWLTLAHLIGARSLSEEIAEETEHAQAELAREHALMEQRRRAQEAHGDG